MFPSHSFPCYFKALAFSYWGRLGISTTPSSLLQVSNHLIQYIRLNETLKALQVFSIPSFLLCSVDRPESCQVTSLPHPPYKRTSQGQDQLPLPPEQLLEIPSQTRLKTAQLTPLSAWGCICWKKREQALVWKLRFFAQSCEETN